MTARARNALEMLLENGAEAEQIATFLRIATRFLMKET